jgi:hypothetical protein
MAHPVNFVRLRSSSHDFSGTESDPEESKPTKPKFTK